MRIKSTSRISVIILYIFMFVMMRGNYVITEAYLAIALGVIWMLFAFIENAKTLAGAFQKKQAIVLTLFLVYWFFIVLFNEGPTSALTSLLSKSMSYIGIYMYWYYRRALHDTEKRRLLTVTLVIWSFYCIKASVFYLQYDYAARTIAQNKLFYGNIAIGDPYALAYGSALIFIMLFNMLIKKKYEKKRLLFIIVVLSLTILCIILTQSTITMLAVIMGIIISMIYRKQEMAMERKNNMATILVCVCFLTLIINLEWVGKYLSVIGSGMDSVYGRRIAALGMSLQGGANQELVMGRNELYIQSINAFMKHPIIGNIISAYNSSGSIGGHSELLDTLATYGGIVGTALIYVILKPLLIINKRSNALKSIGLATTFLVMFALNPFHSQESNFVLLFVLPMISSLFVDNEEGVGMRAIK